MRQCPPVIIQVCVYAPSLTVILKWSSVSRVYSGDSQYGEAETPSESWEKVDIQSPHNTNVTNGDETGNVDCALHILASPLVAHHIVNPANWRIDIDMFV